jgi:hypothetical protein
VPVSVISWIVLLSFSQQAIHEITRNITKDIQIRPGAKDPEP